MDSLEQDYNMPAGQAFAKSRHHSGRASLWSAESDEQRIPIPASFVMELEAQGRRAEHARPKSCGQAIEQLLRSEEERVEQGRERAIRIELARLE